MTMEQQQTRTLFGQDGVLCLLRQYGKPATVDQLVDFMAQTYPKESHMTKEMKTNNLRKLAGWQLVIRVKDPKQKGIRGPFIWRLPKESV